MSLKIRHLHFLLISFCPSLFFGQAPMLDQAYRNEIKNKRNYDLISQVDTITFNPLLMLGIYSKDGYMGIIDQTGKEITTAKYSFIDLRCQDGVLLNVRDHFIVAQGNLEGLVDFNGNEPFPLQPGYLSIAEYEWVDELNLFRIHKMKRETKFKRQIIDMTGQVLAEKIFNENDYEKIEIVAEHDEDHPDDINYEPVEMEVLKDGSYWQSPKLINSIPQKPNLYSLVEDHPIYGTKSGWIDSVHFVFKNNETELYGLLNVRDTTWTIPQEYASIKQLYDFGSGILVLEKNKKFGITNDNFELISKIEWDKIDHFHSSYKVFKNNQFAVFNSSFKQLTKFKFQDAMKYGPRAAFQNIIDTDSNKVLLSYLGVELPYYNPWDYLVYGTNSIKDSFIRINKKEGPLFLNALGKTLYKEQWEKVVAKEMVVSQNCRIKERSSYNMDYFDNEGFFIKKEKLWGFTDSRFKVMIKPQYKNMMTTYDDYLLLAESQNGWGVIELPKGDAIIPLEYEKCPEVMSNFIIVKKEGNTTFFSKSGKLLFNLKNAIVSYTERIAPGLYKAYYNNNDSLYFDEFGSIVYNEK